jgi:hypothetical protein
MSDLSLFLKENKKKKENGFFPATKSLCDADGKPLMWEIKPLSTRDDQELRDECMVQKLIPGKNGEQQLRFDSQKYLVRMMTACIIFPDLDDKKLQDSYGVKSAEDLIVEMIDDPDEFNEFAGFIQEYSGFDDIVDVEQKAKN